MPRSIARLRYKAPRAPATVISRQTLTQKPHLEALAQKQVAAYVERQSNPQHIKLQTVVNPKARAAPTGKHAIAPRKPYTLRDVVDPERTAQHGEIIYIFRNHKTNQVIYSLQELLDNHHLEQLPFIGRHSKPPVVRPDQWVPHCVVTFPSAAQGHSAMRKLREYRHMHELSWQKTNPEWKRLDKKLRIKKIMDQRANTTADLAAVLRGQRRFGAKAVIRQRDEQRKADEILDKRWEQIEALAKAAVDKVKLTDNVNWLQHQIRSLDMKLRMKHNQNEADQKGLQASKASLEKRLGKVEYALRKKEQFKKMQEELSQKAAPANEEDAETKLEELKSQARVMQEALENPDPTRSRADIEVDKDLLAKHNSEIATLEEAFEAKAQLERRDHYIARSVLPRAFKKDTPPPYTLKGVRVQWADLQDALYAAGKWPEAIGHEPLEIYKTRAATLLLSSEEFEMEKMNEVGRIMQLLRPAEDEVEGPLPPALRT